MGRAGTLPHKQNSFKYKTIVCLSLLHDEKIFFGNKKAAEAALKDHFTI